MPAINRSADTAPALERRRAADTAGSTEQLLAEALLSSLARGLLVINAEGRIARVNAVTCDLLGYAASELQGSPYALLLEPQVQGQPDHFLVDLLNQPHPLEQPWLLRHKDGHDLAVEAHTQALADAAHNPCALITFVRQPAAPDPLGTAQRLQAQQHAHELARSRAVLRMVVDNVPAQIAYYDAKSIHCVFANAAYAGANGKTVAWAEGRHCRDIIGDAAWTLIEPQVEQVRRGETISYERELQAPDGSKRRIDVSLLPHFANAGLQAGVFVLIHDISRRYQAEQALRDNEERLRKFAAATTDGIVFHRDGMIDDCNEAMAALLGLPRERVLGRHMTQFFPPELHEQIRSNIAGGVETAYHSDLLRADGGTLPVEAFARSVRFDGQNYRMVVVRNVSERHRLMASLAKSESRYRALVDNAYEAIFVAQDGLVRYVNPAATRLFRSGSPALLGTPSIEMVHPDDRALVMAKRQQMVAGEPVEPYEARMISPPGRTLTLAEGDSPGSPPTRTATRTLWARIYGVRIEWDGHSALLVFVADITESRELREQLSAALTQKDAMLATTAVGVCMLKNRRHQWVNGTLCQMLGYTEAELIGQETRLHYPSLQAFEDTGRAAYAEIAATGASSAEVQMMRRDGSLLWVQIDGRALDGHDLNEGTVWTYVDVTQRKLAEVEMRETLARERELGELKTGFVSMASHEFRTPLTTIQTATDLLLHYADRLPPEDRLASLHDIQDAVNRMKSVMENILMLGKLDGHSNKFKPVPTNVHSLFRQLASETGSACSQSHVMELTPPAEMFEVQPLLDESLMRQIVGNLLSNACKYSPKGSTVRLAWQRTLVAPADGDTRLAPRPMLCVEVIDQGMGIPAADIPRLFETFHRASNAGTIQGTGLGLAIVKRALDTLGGSIEVFSELGSGTRFSLRLPWCE